MEIERKFLVFKKPAQTDCLTPDHLEQAYVCTSPVIRVRQKNDSYILTIKSEGLLAREEFELSLTPEAYRHLLNKSDGIIIRKDRWKIPEPSGLTIELDQFHGPYEGFMMAEVEFPDLETARSFTPAAWFGPEVTEDSRFQNSSLCQRNPAQARTFMDMIHRMEKQPKSFS